MNSVKAVGFVCYTPKGDKGDQGEKGEPGAQGPFVPIPRYWSEYPSGYRFQCGAPGEERKDIVLYQYAGKIYYLACKVSHNKQSYYEPFGANSSQVWETGQQWTFIATQLLLAELARIKNLCAEFIQMLDASGNVVFEALNGNVTCNKGTFNNVDVYGRVVAGDKDGKRIVLDPDTKAVAIYDESGGECARLDGTAYTSSSIMPSGGGAITISSTGVQDIYAYGTATSQATGSKTFTARSSATTVGAVRVNASGKITMDGVSSSGTSTPTMMPHGTLYCIVKTYNTSGTLINTERVFFTSTAESVNGTITSPQTTRSFLVSVPAGRHEVGFEVVASGSPATAAVTLTGATFVADSFIARYFKNGFALTQDTLNYLIGIYEDSVMKLMLGGQFYIDRVKQPKVVYAARVTDTSTNANTACSTSVLTCVPGYSVRCVKTTTVGLYKFTFPSAYSLSMANVKVELTGYGVVAQGGSSASKATVKSYRFSSGQMVIEVLVSDDDSPNYGGFEITVYKY